MSEGRTVPRTDDSTKRWSDDAEIALRRTAQAQRAEIERLRGEIDGLTAAHAREVRALKRDVAALTRQIAEIEAQAAARPGLVRRAVDPR